jgi:SAM-dependent methyltransferase
MGMDITAWLERLQRQDGIAIASAPRLFGGGEGNEDAYVDQFVVDQAYEAALTKGLTRVLDDARVRRDGAALELGCGTGIMTRALTRERFPTLLISDMSPVFVRATRESMPESVNGSVVYLVLDTDDIARVPRRSVSLVLLRYVLHHVLDWRGFLTSAAALLRPGGAVVFEEPCCDGFLLQLMAVELARRGRDQELSEAVRRELDFFTNTTHFYLRADVDKSAAEDKHLFRDSSVRSLLTDLGLNVRFYPNRGLETLGGEAPLPPDAFVREFRHNLAVNFGFSDATLAFFDEHIAPACERVGTISNNDTAPFVKGVFVARRPQVRDTLYGLARKFQTRAAA